MSEKRGTQTELIFTSYLEDRKMLARIEHLFPGCIERLADRSHFLESLLAQAGLPASEEWHMILALSQRENITSIWKRAHPSTLETNAAALLTALAFSSSEQWVKLIRGFFKAHGLEPGIRGRRAVYPKDRTDFRRGIHIDDAIERLEPGFQFKSHAKLRGGFSSDDEEIATALENQGYNRVEISALLTAATVQDAACKCYFATEGKKLSITLKGIQNSYARYKRLVGEKNHRLD